MGITHSEDIIKKQFKCTEDGSAMESPLYKIGEGEVEKIPLEFKPAKSIEEAEQRFKSLTTNPTGGFDIEYIQTDWLKGASLEEANNILMGIEPLLNKYNIKVNRIGFKKEISPSVAEYSYIKSKPKGNGSISFAKDYVHNAAEMSKKAHEDFLYYKRTDIKIAEAILNNPNVKQLHEKAAKRIETLNNIKRHSMSTSSNNPLLYTARHETWHAVGTKYDVVDLFESNLKVFNVSKNEWKFISDYANTNTYELWAEVGTAIDFNIKIPISIKNAFLETLKEVEYLSKL